MGRRPRGIPDDPAQVRMSFGEHLEELRARLIRAILGAVVGLVVCFIFRQQIMAWLVAPLDAALAAHGLPRQAVALQPAEVFTVVFKMCFICGLIVSAPYGLYQVWAFVAAGLYRHERQYVQRIVPASILLFAAGVAFLFYVVLPLVLSFLISIGSWVPLPAAQPRWPARWLLGEQSQRVAPTGPAEQALAQLPVLEKDPPDARGGQVWISAADRQLKVRLDGQTYTSDLRPAGTGSFVRPNFALSYYISFVTHLALGFGVGFQVPIVVVFLSALGIVPIERMAAARRYVILAMVALAAVVTPPDVTSQLLLAGPMILLYEIGLLAARLLRRRRESSGD